MRWLKWALFALSVLIGVVGLVIAYMSGNYLTMLETGNWTDDAFLSDIVVQSVIQGEDPADFLQFYRNVGIFLCAIAGAVIGSYIAVYLARRHTPDTA